MPLGIFRTWVVSFFLGGLLAETLEELFEISKCHALPQGVSWTSRKILNSLDAPHFFQPRGGVGAQPRGAGARGAGALAATCITSRSSLRNASVATTAHLPQTAGLDARQVVSRVEAYARGPGARRHVALVPSPRDVHHDAVFPQPPLALPPGGPANLLLLPNPATFRVNETVVGVATPDLLKALAGQAWAETLKPKTPPPPLPCLEP